MSLDRAGVFVFLWNMGGNWNFELRKFLRPHC